MTEKRDEQSKSRVVRKESKAKIVNVEYIVEQKAQYFIGTLNVLQKPPKSRYDADEI